MKSFMIALLLLVLMLGLVAANTIYINNVANHLQDMLSVLPDVGEEGCLAGADEIREYWERNAPYVGLSVSYTVADRLSEHAAVLSACAACDDFYGFRSALALLRDAVKDMKRLENISVEAFF